jgi:hypothetical protein
MSKSGIFQILLGVLLIAINLLLLVHNCILFYRYNYTDILFLVKISNWILILFNIFCVLNILSDLMMIIGKMRILKCVVINLFLLVVAVILIYLNIC